MKPWKASFTVWCCLSLSGHQCAGALETEALKKIHTAAEMNLPYSSGHLPEYRIWIKNRAYVGSYNVQSNPYNKTWTLYSTFKKTEEFSGANYETLSLVQDILGRESFIQETDSDALSWGEARIITQTLFQAGKENLIPLIESAGLAPDTGMLSLNLNNKEDEAEVLEALNCLHVNPKFIRFKNIKMILL